MKLSEAMKPLNAEDAVDAVEHQVALRPSTADESRRVAAVACHPSFAF